ncbi:MAG TPA: FliM/FliN family flagellar motor switch protein [Stellaceae bacterium]|nr:FliM/FliN family flagellar motor switch protein [Stellaceae bacterium]
MSDVDEQTVAAAEGPPIYDLFSEAGPARSRLSNLEPTLQRINDRFVRYLRAALLQHLRRGVTITTTGVKMIEHRELMEQLGSPTHLTLFTMRPLRGVIVLMVDAPLVVSLVESRFGGSGRFPINIANRDFTAFELKSMRRVVDTTLEQFIIAWEPLGRFEIGPLRHETNPQFASFAHADELIMASIFDVTVDQGKGKIATYIPYAAVEPLQEQLMAGLVADGGDNDGHWSDTLLQGVQQASITLNVELGKIDISVGDLIGLRPGNIFEMDRPDSLVVEANGVPLFRGRWGRHGRKIGVLVEERLPPLTAEATRPLRRPVRREDG